MSSNLDATIAIEHVHHTKRGEITRLAWKGWMVDIDGVSVTVPLQDTAGKTIADLGTLLGAAYRMVNIPIARGPAPLARIRADLPAVKVREVVDVLRAAQAIAENDCHRRTFDIYGCISRAWRNADMPVPHTLLIATLRAALPPATTLADYTHQATLRGIQALFDQAIELWRRDPQCGTTELRRAGVA
jgi:hypothetical protein